MNNTVGIYIHIPYCRSKCPYCDFFSMRGNDNEYKKYTDILKENIKYWGIKISETVDTIYIGGGTPSVIGNENISDILNCVKNNFNISENAEITMEINPESGKKLNFKNLYDSGINRISIGLQSADSNELKKLGRIHSISDVTETINLAKTAGIDNISLDIMLGIPEQNMESLKNTIDFCVESGVKHISSYILKIEENTFYYKNPKKFNFPDDDTVSDFYLFSVDYLSGKGFKQYEISNFSVPGYESKHNLKYWNLENYIGIGPAAHSFYGNKRFYYGRSIEDFKNNKIIKDGFGGSKEEYIMLKLRLTKGLYINEYKKAFGEDFTEDFYKKIDIYNKAGYLNYGNGIISLTPKGFLVSNNIISDLI